MSFNTILFDEVDNVVEVQYQGVNAAILAEHEVRITTLETSTAADFAALQAELNAFEVQLNTLTLLVQQNYAAIQEEIQNRGDADDAMNESLSNDIIATQQAAAAAIAAEADIRAAAIINEANTRGTAIVELETQVNTDISAIATTVDALASQVAGNTANIVLANEAIVTETAARTAQYEALQVDFGDTNAAVLEESVARADGDDALASQITVLEADVDGAYAAVMTEQTARIAGDNALSSSITTLSAQVGTNTTAISAETSARISADGSIESKYAVKIDVNGRVSGFGLISTANNATPTSIFAVTADSFKVYNGTTDVAPFSVSGGTVYLDNLVVRSTVRQGQTAFDTGTGFWLGDVSGTPKFSIGNSSGNKLTWDGSALNVTGAINMTNSVDTFTPGWDGFSTNPSGTLSYLDLGAIVFIWAPTTCIGISNRNFTSITGVPTAIRPSQGREVSCMLWDNGSLVAGAAKVETGGSIVLRVLTSNTGTDIPVKVNSTGFTDSGVKGLPTGFLLIYAK
jgi:hypothetical protein